MEINFSGKRALVTGAGKGIGRAVAIRLAECGAEVIAVSRTQSDLDELAKVHSNIKTLFLDVGDWENTKTAIEAAGDIDLLVNNAGIVVEKPMGAVTDDDLEKVYKINLKAAINISQIVFNNLKSRGKGGAIVNVSSIAGFNAAPGIVSYCTSKGALDQLTRCTAAEFGPHNIRVNSVNPGAVRTRMAESVFDPEDEFRKIMLPRTPLGKFCEVDDVAYPILFLLSDYASMITGVTLPIEGGLTVMF